MDTVHLSPTKNIGVVFQPRSGSHVLVDYLATALGFNNLAEIFNASLTPTITDNVVEFVNGGEPFLDKSDHNRLNTDMLARLDFVRKLHKTEHSVFKIFLESYIDVSPNLSNDICQLENTQFIRLERANVLEAMMSRHIAIKSGVWHHKISDGMSVSRVFANNMPTVTFPPALLVKYLNTYIASQIHAQQYFGNAQIIYYEQFQQNAGILRNIFTGIPKKFASIPYTKLPGNSVDLISNVDEIADIYAQFVTDHSEFFPQHFDKLPGLSIPLSMPQYEK